MRGEDGSDRLGPSCSMETSNASSFWRAKNFRIQRLPRSFVVPKNGTPQDDGGMASLSNFVGHAVGRNLRADAHWLATLVGEKQNRFGVLIQMPGIGARARPAVPLVLNVAVHHEVTSRLDAQDLRLERSRRPILLDANRAEGGEAAAGPDTWRTSSPSQTSQNDVCASRTCATSLSRRPIRGLSWLLNGRRHKRRCLRHPRNCCRAHSHLPAPRFLYVPIPVVCWPER